MNVLILTGNLTRDPELKYGQGGKAYCKFSIAVKKAFGDGVDYFNCVAFGKTAELTAEYLRKGSKTGLEGCLSTSQYGKDGEKRTSIEVIVNRVEFLEKKNKEEETSKNEIVEPESFEEDEDSTEFPF